MQKHFRQADPDTLYSAILKIASPLKPVPCQTVDSIVFIRPEDIAYIMAVPGGLDIVDTNNAHWKRFDTITAMVEKFKLDTMFFKVNRGEIVNLRQVKALYVTPTGTREVAFRSLPADVRVTIADSSYPEFKKAMGISDKAAAALDKKPAGRKKNVRQ